MIGSVVGNRVRSIRHLPRNEDAAFSADMHAFHSVIEARNEASRSLREGHGLWIA